MKVGFWNDAKGEEDVIDNVNHVNFYRDHIKLYLFNTNEEKEIPLHLVLSIDSELWEYIGVKESEVSKSK